MDTFSQKISRYIISWILFLNTINVFVNAMLNACEGLLILVQHIVSFIPLDCQSKSRGIKQHNYNTSCLGYVQLIMGTKISFKKVN